jgi:succinyl-CoA synthetase alpha subunit
MKHGPISLITEGVPVQDMTRALRYVKDRGARLLGPNCPGIISPGKAKVGILPAQIVAPGPVGVISRSGTLTYEAVYHLTLADVGQTTCVGIGGDPVPGTSFVDVLSRFKDDPETEAIVLIGEIGGDAEEQAAAYIAAEVDQPVVSYIAGVTAPPGKKMGHAGAIISGSSGTAQAKQEALEAVGATVVTDPTMIGEAVAGLL